MFNSWSSLTGAISKRSERFEKRVEKERSKSHCEVETRKSKIEMERKLRSLTTLSAPSKISITKTDAEATKKETKKHAFTPIKINETPKKATSSLSLMQTKFGTRRRTYSERSKTEIEKLNGKNQTKIDYNQYHIKVWQQAYSFGCR